MLVLVVGPEGPQRAAIVQQARALGHAVVEGTTPRDVPLDLAPEWLVCVSGEDPSPWTARLGPTSVGPVPEDRGGRLLTLAATKVDLRTKRVFGADGQVQTLLDMEAALLAYLVARAGDVVGREELLIEVWGYEPTMRTRTVDNTVRRLRMRIEADSSEPQHVCTVRGDGYRFVPLPGTPAVPVSSMVAVPAAIAAETVPAPSGTLRLGCMRDRGTLALYAWGASMWTMVRPSVVESIVTVDRQGRVRPGPLASVEVDEDGLGAVLTLRPGLRFHPHPGLPAADATADDLQASLELALAADRVSLPLAPDGMQVVGPLALRMTFERPVGLLAHRLEGALLVPAALLELDDPTDLKRPVGTGPFRFPDDHAELGGLELVAHLEHWRRREGAAVPGVARIKVVLVQLDQLDPAIEAIATEEVDLAGVVLETPRAELVRRASEVGARVALAARRTVVTALVWFRDGPAGLDASGRRALHRVVDRRSLLADGDEEFEPTARFLPEVALGYDLGFEAPEPGPMPALARPLTIGVHASNRALGEALAAQLDDLGVPARVVPLGSSASAEQFAAPTIDGAVLVTHCRLWGIDPQPHLEALVRPFVQAGVLGPEALDLLDDLAGTTRRRERIQRVRALVAHLHDQVPVMPLLWARDARPSTLVGPRVHGFDDPRTGRELPSDLVWSQVTVDGD